MSESLAREREGFKQKINEECNRSVDLEKQLKLQTLKLKALTSYLAKEQLQKPLLYLKEIFPDKPRGFS